MDSPRIRFNRGAGVCRNYVRSFALVQGREFLGEFFDQVGVEIQIDVRQVEGFGVETPRSIEVASRAFESGQFAKDDSGTVISGRGVAAESRTS